MDEKWKCFRQTISRLPKCSRLHGWRLLKVCPNEFSSVRMSALGRACHRTRILVVIAASRANGRCRADCVAQPAPFPFPLSCSAIGGLEKGGGGELPPSGLAKGGGMSSGPTSRAIDAPNGVRVGAGCLVMSVGSGPVWLRWCVCALNYLHHQHGHGADTPEPMRKAPRLS